MNKLLIPALALGLAAAPCAQDAEKAQKPAKAQLWQIEISGISG